MSHPVTASRERVFLETFETAARQAGGVALRLQGRVANEGKAGGGTPEADALTLVDLAAQDVVLELLLDRLPGIAVDAEEDTELARRFEPPSDARDLVVLDPIDGTLSYVMGTEDWAVMAGLLREGRFQASALYYPARDLMLVAARGQGSFQRYGRGQWKRTTLIDSTGLPNKVLVGARFPDLARQALSPLGVTAETCRCSAVEATAPLLGRGVGAMTHHAIDRRHTIGLFASLEAGASVWLGDQVWSGEDVERKPFDGPTAVASVSEKAQAWIEAVRPALWQ